MNLVDLEVFDAVVLHCSLSDAAMTLGLASAEVASRIEILESELVAKLFDHAESGLVLSEAGRRFLPHAAHLKTALKAAQRSTNENGAPRGPLAIGCVEEIVANRIADALYVFVRQNPQIQMQVRTDSSLALLEDVVCGRLDGAFVFGPIAHPMVLVEQCFAERLSVVTSRSWRADPSNERRAEKLLVLHSAEYQTQMLEIFLKTRGIGRWDVHECGSWESILACVAAGIGITIMPSSLAERHMLRSSLRLHDGMSEDCYNKIVFLRRRTSQANYALAAFLALLRSSTDAAESDFLMSYGQDH